MSDIDTGRLLEPLVRSWRWFLVCGGFLVLYGVVQISSSILIPAIFFWTGGPEEGLVYGLYLPAGVLAVAAGWQFVQLARSLTRGTYAGVGGLRRFASRFRLIAILLGSYFLVMFFIGFSRFMFEYVRVAPW